MAKSKGTQSKAIVIRENIRPQAPIIRVAMPRAPAKKKQRRHRGGGGTRETSISRLATVGGISFAIAELEKTEFWKKLPALPFIGKKGTALLILHYGKIGGSWSHDAQISLAAIAGYELGKEGSISGEEGTADGAFR